MLSIRAITFTVHQRHRRTDGETDDHALDYVHRAVKMFVRSSFSNRVKIKPCLKIHKSKELEKMKCMFEEK